MVSAFWDLPNESCRLNGPPCHFLWDYEGWRCHFVQFVKLKCWCQHPSLLQFLNIHTYTLKYLWNHGRHECLSYQLRSSCCLFCLLFPHFLHNIMYSSYKNADQKRLSFPVYAMYMLAAFAKFLYLLGIFLAYFHFDSVCNCVCCFCCATALNSACLTASGLFFKYFGYRLMQKCCHLW